MSFSFVNEAATGSAETLTAEWCQYFACWGRCAPADTAVKTALSTSLVGVAVLLAEINFDGRASGVPAVHG